jgi:para-aminobenzoate synthetase / 4-amino-4-deoxychorismate lyase
MAVDSRQESDSNPHAQRPSYVQLPARSLALAASTPGSILLQTSRCDAANFRSYLFLRPSRMLVAGSALFDQIEQALAEGAYVAGFFGYECGEGLQQLGRSDGANSKTPLAWFGVYPEALVFDHRTGKFESGSPDHAMVDAAEANENWEIRNVRLGIGQQEYARKIASIHESIRAGDTYQVNFTDKLHFDYSGSPAAIYASLIDSQPVPYSAFLHGAGWHILSLSPELFFRVARRRIVTRPVKGTARRGRDLAEDETIARWLQNDSKNRSENVMIVDLLRNDLGRICEYGSVQVDELFAVETYRTIFQMASQISGTLRPEVSSAGIFESLFPCGSVTGAPKHRTMQIIHELERAPRGVYTGAIGFFSPVREAVFSVPIRTVVLKDGRGVMGVGSGIVIDSQAEDEYRECLLKSEFLTRRAQSDDEPFDLLESILWEDGYRWLPLHLDRMESSARYFDFQFERATVLAALQDAASGIPPGVCSKVRVSLARTGAVIVSHAPVEPQSGHARVLFSAIRVHSGDRFLRHKTTRRRLFDEQYAQARKRGYDEVLFLNERGEVTQGAISNVWVEKDGRCFTPPVACGLLPGIYRRHLLETGRVEEKPLLPQDLASADAVYICNAVRGSRKAELA